MIFRARRAGFTLIELGTAMVIIGLLASAVLFAMYHVQEDAKKKRTRTVITKINELIMPEWTGNQFELPDGSRAPPAGESGTQDPDSGVRLPALARAHGCPPRTAKS